MHYYFQYLATEIAHERMAEARNWRLATEARRGEARPGVVERLRVLFASRRAQPTPTPTFSRDSEAA
jgi:hypothetical protein